MLLDSQEATTGSRVCRDKLAAQLLEAMFDMGFGERLRDARSEARLTQEQLAEQVGLTQGAVSALEGGRSNTASAAHIFAYADALGVNARWLATGEGERRPAKRSDLQALLSAAESADPETIAAVVAILKRR